MRTSVLTSCKIGRILFAGFLLCLSSAMAVAGSWVDITSQFVKNPSYDGNNYDYWEGTRLSGANPAGNAEHWYKSYNTYQTITGLAEGRYRLSLQAYYYMGSDDYELWTSGEYVNYQYARLYANSSVGYFDEPIVPESSGACSTPPEEGLGWMVDEELGLYMPNNMYSANAWFEAGYYNNSVECEVGSDGVLTIGISKDWTRREDWTCIDNWKLEYYEEQAITRITDLSLNYTEQTMAVGTSYTLKPTILPTNATNKTLIWTSSDETVATVDANGKVTGVKGGKVVITATTTDLSGLSASCAFTIYNRSDNDKDWLDITDDYIINPRFDGNDVTTGWSGTQFSAANPKENAEHFNKTYDTYQVLTGLPAGHYRLSLKAFYRQGSSSSDYSHYYNYGDYEEYQYAKLYAKSSLVEYATPLVPLATGCTETNLSSGSAIVSADYNNYPNIIYKYVPNDMVSAAAWFNAGYYDNSVECDVADDGVLTIGIKKEGHIGDDWTCLDDWKLEYYGPVKLVSSVTLSESTISLVVTETHQLQAQILPTNAVYRKLQWTSSDEGVARVDANGLITAISVGKAIITAKSTDGSNKTATCEVNVVASDISGNNIIINEIMAANVDVYLDPSYNYGSWVELYNPTSAAIPLGGLYVSDDAKNLKKHKLVENYGILPAHGFAVLNFDHHEVWKPASYRQIDDKLDMGGGTIIISDGTNIIAQQDYPEAISRVSYARTTDGGSTWGTTAEPTPGASNTASIFAEEQLDAPVVDTPAQLFNGSLSIKVTIPNGAILRYTTNGTAPTLTNGSTSETGIFTVRNTTCYRFRLFQDGKLPSTVVTRSYIENNGNEPFPIISIVTDRNNIYGSEYGVFSKSGNGRPGNGQSSSCNWNMDWDRPVSFEYITTDNECVVSQECDFAMCGGWSRAWEPHSFKLKAKKVYDLKNSFDYQFFDNKPFLKYKTLQIRNGGNDTGCRIKDPAIQGVVERSGLYVDYQSWKPVHVYINGSQYAVLNMREPNNKDFAESNYGIDTDLMDQFEMSPDSGYVQMRGTEDSFERLYNLSADAANDATYEEISKLVDIDEYINYMAVEMYCGGTDWPQNNVKGFRDQNDGKFHFVLFDLDGTLATSTPLSSFFGKEWYTFDRLYGYDYSQQKSIDNTQNYRQIKFVSIFKNMLKNETFKKKFIDSYCLVAGSVFAPDFVSEVVNERAAILSQGDYVYPYSTSNSVISGFANRQNSLVNHLQSYFSLSDNIKITANISSNIDEASILLNDMNVPTGKFDGKLFSPITLKAVAPVGYKFAGWQSMGSTSANTIFSYGSPWKFYDKGSLDDYSWQSANYNDGGWSSGDTPIGYDYNNQHPELVTETEGWLTTYYFRKDVNLSSVDENDVYTLNWIADDGFVLYVNGVEAGRYNMPNGTISYDTYASTYAHSNPDSGTMGLPTELFHAGNNVIALELHNNSYNSTDIYWNAELYVQKLTDGDIVSTDEEYTLPSSGTVQLKAVWEALPADELIATTTPVKINEVSAANSVYLNEYFKKNDWIELYNTTDKDIDVAGMYISDKLSKPKKYQIPEASAVAASYSTIIPAHGYLVVWADQLVADKQIHTGFKLGNEDDEVVMLTAADESWSDTLAYKTHNGTQSVGLYPDGGSKTYVMDLPTIGASNVLTSYAQEFEQFRPEPEPEIPTDVKSVTSDGALSIAYNNGVLTVNAEEPMGVSVEILNAAGQKVYSATAEVSGSSRFSLDGLPTGIYIAKVTGSEDNRCQLKFIKR